jgi:hypothetical protein
MKVSCKSTLCDCVKLKASTAVIEHLFVNFSNFVSP